MSLMHSTLRLWLFCALVSLVAPSLCRLVRQAKDQALPTLSLNGAYNVGDQPVTPQLGYPTVAAHTRNLSASLVLSIPIFSGFSQSYAIQKAQAEASQKSEDMRAVERDLKIALETCVVNLKAKRLVAQATREILDNSTAGFMASSNRYSAGAGTVNELISGASTLANSRKAMLKSSFDMVSVRTECARSTGDFNAVR